MILTKENLLTDDLIEASNENSAYPITNALISENNIPFKASALTVTIDLKTNIDATLLCISGHNFVWGTKITSDKLVKVTSDSKVKSFGSATTIMLQHYSDINYTNKISEEAIDIEETIIHKIAFNGGYKRLVISSFAIPSIGYIKLCKYIDADVLANTGKPSLELTDEYTEMSLGTNNSQERFDMDNIALTFRVEESILESFFEIFRKHRLTEPMFIWQFPDGYTYKNKRCVVFDQKRLAPTRKIYGKNVIYYSFTVAFKEAK